MKLPVYRAIVYIPGPDLKPDPEGRPHLLYSFRPIEPDPDDPREAGSGPSPWRELEVPDGSRLELDPWTGEEVLIVPGQDSGLEARQVAELSRDDDPAGDSAVMPAL